MSVTAVHSLHIRSGNYTYVYDLFICEYAQCVTVVVHSPHIRSGIVPRLAELLGKSEK